MARISFDGMRVLSHFCPDCQSARLDEWERRQEKDTIDPSQPYGQHIYLNCANHPELRWHTKNIGFIGARSIFYSSIETPECDCSVSLLQPVER